MLLLGIIAILIVLIVVNVSYNVMSKCEVVPVADPMPNSIQISGPIDSKIERIIHNSAVNEPTPNVPKLKLTPKFEKIGYVYQDDAITLRDDVEKVSDLFDKVAKAPDAVEKWDLYFGVTNVYEAMVRCYADPESTIWLFVHKDHPKNDTGTHIAFKFVDLDFVKPGTSPYTHSGYKYPFAFSNIIYPGDKDIWKYAKEMQ